MPLSATLLLSLVPLVADEVPGPGENRIRNAPMGTYDPAFRVVQSNEPAGAPGMGAGRPDAGGREETPGTAGGAAAPPGEAGSATTSANPAAVNIISGTGALGRFLGIDPDSGIRLGGLWIAAPNGILTVGVAPGGGRSTALTTLALTREA